MRDALGEIHWPRLADLLCILCWRAAWRRVVLLPEIFALQMTASGDVSFPKTVIPVFPDL